ncbi:MAG: HVO_0476 family zinc finger protein [Halococcoides sp.]
MTPADRLAVTCPACSPDRETVHEVLNRGGQLTVRCGECDHVHKTDPPDNETVTRSVVVSQDGESWTASTEVPTDEYIAVGEEFVLETEAAIVTARITSLEVDGGRLERAPADEVDTIWTRAVGNVSVDATIHPADGTHDETASATLHLPGDREFEIGETVSVDDREATLQRFQVRDDARGYDRRRYDERGESAPAKDLDRIYLQTTGSTAWSAW